MTFGYYTPIYGAIGDLTNADSTTRGNDALIALAFLIGTAVGIWAVAKLIEMLLKKYEVQSYWGIIGFVLASAIIIATVPGPPPPPFWPAPRSGSTSSVSPSPPSASTALTRCKISLFQNSCHSGGRSFFLLEWGFFVPHRVPQKRSVWPRF